METANQHYHLILADIAMAAAISAYDPDYNCNPGDGYRPGAIRDAWFERAADDELRKKVTAMANAAMGSLANLPPDALVTAAEKYGVPLTAEAALMAADHFSAKRDAVLTYRR